MIDFTGQNAVFVVLSAVLNRFIPVLGMWVANLLSSALAARLSQRDEYEADAYATALLIKSGIGTEPQKSLFRKLDRMTGAGGASAPDWLRSHPKSAERIAAIEANERRWLQRA
jgi:putative metalloprotease